MNKNARFTFGIYKNQTLDEVSSTQKGLLYLDKMVDWMKEKGMHIADPTFYNDLCEYLQQPKIAEEIEEAIDNKEDKEELPEAKWYKEETTPPRWWEK